MSEGAKGDPLAARMSCKRIAGLIFVRKKFVEGGRKG